MKRFLLGFLTAFSLPALVFIIVLMTMPNLRHTTLRFVAELPSIAVYFIVRKYVFNRNFEQATVWLEKQLDMVDSFAPGRNSYLPGLAENARYVIDQTRFAEEKIALQPFLNRLVTSQPDFFLGRLWLAQSLSYTDTEAAFGELEVAAKLVSADERIYRTAINLAIKSGQPDQQKSWCKRYLQAQFGGAHSYSYNTPFIGEGLRMMALEATDKDGNRQLVGHKGLQLGGPRTYDFSFLVPISTDRFRLHLGILPGISMQLEEVSFFQNGIKKVQPRTTLTLTSRNGFYSRDGHLLSTSRDGETLSFHISKPAFQNADRVTFLMGFERLLLSDPSLCGASRTP